MIVVSIATFLLYVTKYNKMSESVSQLIDSCFEKHKLTQPIPDALKHYYTKLGLIGYEWMAKGFHERTWTRNDFFFFLNNDKKEEDILAQNLKRFNLPDGKIDYSQLLYLCRKGGYGETDENITQTVTYTKESKTIHIHIEGSVNNRDIVLSSYSDKEAEEIIFPWMVFGLDLLARITPEISKFIINEEGYFDNIELMYHAQPFMPVSVVYLVDTDDKNKVYWVSLTPREDDQKLMFVHPLTPNVITPKGTIILIASIVDNHYLVPFEDPDNTHMELLCLYRKSLGAQ